MAKSKELFCEWCGTSFVREALFAMLIDLGCKTNADPLSCYESPTKKHEFVQASELIGKEAREDAKTNNA